MGVLHSRHIRRKNLPYFLGALTLLFIFLRQFSNLCFGPTWEPGWPLRSYQNIHHHPVELLHLHAEKEFERLLARQSHEPEAAEAEYKRRYDRRPPPAFREWVKHAIELGSPIIDDFDLINENISPFLQMTPHHIKDLMKRAADTGTRVSQLGICDFADGQFSHFGQCRTDWVLNMESILGEAAQRLPSFTVLMNYLDEPNVLPTSLDNGAALNWTTMDHRPNGHLVREACDKVGLLQRGHRDRSPIPAFGLPFVQQADTTKDACQHPEYADMHGFFLSPDTFKRMPVRIPILSNAAPYPFADILFPSPQYVNPKNAYDPQTDRPWEEKENVAYWAGSSTGSHGTSDENSWRHSHRQRLAAFGMHKENRTYTYLDNSTGTYRAYESAEFNTSLFHTRITTAIQCDVEACDAMNDFFAPVEREDWTEPFKYRYLFDVDGNSYTNRFYRLLGADSVPLKMTIFREWHDERLVPWLHYIPISQSLDEVPELMRFLVTTESGQRISRRIAAAGKEWHAKALAPQQQGIYLYRLMMELAWLQDESREID